MASHGTTDTETATTTDDTTKADPTTADPATDGPTTADPTTDGPAATDTATVDPTVYPEPGTAGATPSPTGGAAPSPGFVAGALALVSAGLGLVSLTGTSLGDMMRARQELLGQITAATGGQVDQIEVLYGSPWHTVALVDTAFAVIAAVLGAVLLATRARTATAPGWVAAVALGGTVLGVIGLLVSAGMYLDLFAPAPQLPTLPGLGG